MLTEISFYHAVLLGWLGVAAAVFVVLQFVVAPYGRHARKGWGPSIPRTAGWVLMEFPAAALLPFIALISVRTLSTPGIVFLFIWLLHYLNRTFIFPFRMRGGEGRMPVLIVASGFVFNGVNGYLQGGHLFLLGPERGVEWLWDPRFVSGALIFLCGWLLNMRADAKLRALRTPGQTGYKIPRGGAFRWVSCPNYLGEIIEWTGWALATWSVAGLAFALWTAANLVPRALAHHRWYRKTFPDYPTDRKAIIPGLY